MMSASWSARSAFRVNSSGSPGPAPTSVTSPAARGAVDVVASRRCAICRAPWGSPSMNRRAAGPSTTASKKRRRSSVSRSRSRLVLRRPRSQIARSPRRFGRKASSRSRRRRAKTGDVPPVETATTMGSRSTMAGTMKREASRSSTTFTGMARASLNLAMKRLTARREVATTTSRTPSKSSGTNSRATSLMVPAAPRSCNPGAILGATTVMTAPVRSSNETLRNATSPPPTTRTWSPWRSKKTGKYFTAIILAQLPAPRSLRRARMTVGLERRPRSAGSASRGLAEDGCHRRDFAARVQSALTGIGAFPPPSPGALIVAGLYRTGAGCAADAREAAVVQGVVRQPLLANVIPNFRFRPIEQRTHLVQPILAVPFHRGSECPAGGLAAPDAGDPCTAAGDPAAGGAHFAHGTAAAALVQTVTKSIDAVLVDPAFHFSRIGIVDPQRPAVASLHAFDQIIGFRIEPAGVDGEDLDFRDRLP